jgi:HK97 gp10 family phage protein
MRLNKDPKKEFGELTKKLTNPKKFLQELGPLLVNEVWYRIETKKTDPEGRKWKPWATSTAQARRREGSAGSGLLFRTGELRDSIDYKVQGQKVVVQSDSPYGRYLQEGTSKMPARPFLGMGKSERKIIQDTWRKWLS